MVKLLPQTPRAIVAGVINRGGWLFGSTIRKLLTNSPISDLDMILPNGGALYYFKRLLKKQLAKHLWEIDGYLFHVCPRVDFRFAPMFDVDMLGLSRDGIGIRPLSPVEERFSYDLDAILSKISRKEFSIYPSHERSFYYETKLANLISAGWRRVE